MTVSAGVHHRSDDRSVAHGRVWRRHRHPRLTPALAALVVTCVVASSVAGATPTGSQSKVVASASGRTFAFGPSGGVVAGAVVSVLEQPGASTTTDASGDWQIDGLTVGSTATFVLEAPGRPTLQTATLTVPPEGLTQVSLQTPDQAIFDAMAGILDVEPDPTRCTIASTVTRRELSLYAGAPDGTHGEPGALVTLTPAGDSATWGPIYFNLLRFDVIWPDPALTATTADGGVLFVDVPPGDYVLSATKPGTTIRDAAVGCRAGVLSNAAPPWGLQVLTGGMDPDEVVPPTTTPAPTSTAPPTSAPPTTAAPSPVAPTAQPILATPTLTG